MADAFINGVFAVPRRRLNLPQNLFQAAREAAKNAESKVIGCRGSSGSVCSEELWKTLSSVCSSRIKLV